jgi:hypothetical protein
MALRTAEQAAKRAEALTINKPGMCQQWTRDLYGAPSVGDVDKDGDADAVDGWKKEKKKHTDRNPPRGAVVSWSGGKRGYGHRAISLGDGMVRSTDAGGEGRVATVPLGWIEKNWGLKYEGWSETVSGIDIPGLKLDVPKVPSKPAPKPEPPKKKSIGVIAQEVIAGKWGNGADRKAKLKAAGYDYADVKDEVNRRLNR